MAITKLPKWVRYRAAAYLRGRGLSLEVPDLVDGPLFPILAHEGNTYNLRIGTAPMSPVMGNDLGAFTNEYFDHVVIPGGHELQNDLVSKLKYNGHLVIIGKGCPSSGSWQIKEDIEVDGVRVAVYKKLYGKDNNIKPQKIVNDKRVLIARYGAIGDALQLTPIIHHLYDEGYRVTLNVSPYTVDIYKHNPYVDNIIVQERNVIPNADLGEYWNYWESHYERYINFSESIEGKLLKVEGRADFYTPNEWRRKHCNFNYHDQHVKLAGISDIKYHKPEFYFSRSEEKDILNDFKYLDKAFKVMWALKGSSYHKLYAFYPEVAQEWLDKHPDSYIMQIGGVESIPLQIDHDRAIPLAGGWEIRKSILATKHADLVIGPESAITNAASCWDTPKIIYLSHSSDENLTKYWSNTTVLKPDTSVAPCYPCHQLHYSEDSCPLVEVEIDTRVINKIPVCATAISPETMYNAMESVYLRWKESRI